MIELPKNAFNDKQIAEESFAYRDLLGVDQWNSFTVTASLTVVGTPTYVGRYRFVGKQCFFQISALASTSIAITAGTHYFALPTTTAKGIAGEANMSNGTTRVPVGACHVDIALGRVYPPAQAASGNTFLIAGQYEIG